MSNKNALWIIVVLSIVILFNVRDLIDDFSTGDALWHIIEELIMIGLALGLITVLLINIQRQKKELEQIQSELQFTVNTLEKTDQRMLQIRQQYGQFIQQQFEDWQLSKSEQEVAILLLKGLSFNEISALRQTKEKTVRQQASEIYKKSGTNGRHAFSAWFFEDFIN